MKPLSFCFSWIGVGVEDEGGLDLTSSSSTAAFPFPVSTAGPFFLFSKGAFITFHSAPQFAVGNSETLILCLLAVCAGLGGNEGAGRDGKPGGVGTTKPDCLRTIVECDSTWGRENCLITKQLAHIL